ncbi:hypothetical protein AQUCO_02200245v1 [Aquilegia coerulea]|uniref:Metallo-beta-lactamase domain-containing protein n=1 Tax=Aquilegia coerulea TaxID=218851 RepID=A0A2G5DEL7_AQUCA|nr:hypothetical protein AQUCO_02200245v1 [Aquilegia coerulea]
MENGNCFESESKEKKDSSSSLLFLGTGCSSAVPNVLCLIQPSNPPCEVCTQSLSIPPEKNPNYRCNTSLLIDYRNDNGEHKYILIDVGKTFREQVLRWFTHHNIPQVDSIILTHEHADAVLGLDDIRAVQPFSPTNDIEPTQIYLTQFAMDSVAEKFPYLVQKKLKEGQEVRRVAQLDWNIIKNDFEELFVSSGLQFVPLPVMHGEDYVSLGFLFGSKSRIAYISDVSRFPSNTEHVISKTGGGQLDLLILDTLYKVSSFLLCLGCLISVLSVDTFTPIFYMLVQWYQRNNASMDRNSHNEYDLTYLSLEDAISRVYLVVVRN